MGNAKGIKREFERWPAYKKLYLNAFDRMLKVRREAKLETTWETADEVMKWWIGSEE